MFAGKVCLVTGAGAGIGRSLCEKLLSKRAKVVGLDVNEQGLNDLELQAKKYAHSFRWYRCDVSDQKALSVIATEVMKREKHIDIWINNAGISGHGAFESFDPKAFDRVLAVNLNGVIYGSRIALECMRDRGAGLVVNMASLAGHMSPAFFTAYSAAKHGVVGFTRSLRNELTMSDSPIKVMLVSPGFVDTGIIERGASMGFPEWLSFLLAKPEQIATETMQAMEKNKSSEIYPGINSKLLHRINRWLPGSINLSTKLLLSESPKDFLTGRIRLVG